MRHDLPQSLKSKLAHRAGVRCSNPTCRKPTSGPHGETTNFVNIGVAAHITAASPGGPRYDHSILPAERSSISNAIWLCQNCAKLIDSDPDVYTVSVLKSWKEEAEATARREVETSGNLGVDDSSRCSPGSSRPRVVPTENGAPSFLLRITSGEQLTALVADMCAASYSHDDLEADHEVDAVAGILQLVQDWGDISSGLDISEKVRMNAELSKNIDELDKKGFWIFGAREMQQLEGGDGPPEPWPVAHVYVARKNNETIVRVPFGENRMKQGDPEGDQPPVE